MVKMRPMFGLCCTIYLTLISSLGCFKEFVHKLLKMEIKPIRQEMEKAHMIIELVLCMVPLESARFCHLNRFGWRSFMHRILSYTAPNDSQLINLAKFFPAQLLHDNTLRSRDITNLHSPQQGRVELVELSLYPNP